MCRLLPTSVNFFNFVFEGEYFCRTFATQGVSREEDMGLVSHNVDRAHIKRAIVAIQVDLETLDLHLSTNIRPE